MLGLEVLIFTLPQMERAYFHDFVYGYHFEVAWKQAPGVGDLMYQEAPGASLKSSTTSSIGIRPYARCTAMARVT